MPRKNAAAVALGKRSLKRYTPKQRAADARERWAKLAPEERREKTAPARRARAKRCGIS